MKADDDDEGDFLIDLVVVIVPAVLTLESVVLVVVVVVVVIVDIVVAVLVDIGFFVVSCGTSVFFVVNGVVVAAEVTSTGVVCTFTTGSAVVIEPVLVTDPV